MARYAFPRVAGVKIRGGNLVPRASDWTVERARGWSSLWVAWANGDPTVWTQHLQPLIDAAAALGVNCLRVMMDPTILYGSGLTVTSQANFEAVMGQFGAYLASLGIWWYVTPCTSANLDHAHTNNSVSQAQIETYIGIVVAYTSALPNVLGYDVVQEIDYQYIGGVTFAADHTAAWISAATAARVAPLPVTCSFFVVNASDLAPSYKYPAIQAAGAEFRDMHIYFQPAGVDTAIDAVLADTSPTWIGEMGIQADGTFTGSTASTPAALYASMAGWSGKANLQGIVQWAVFGLPVPYGDWGLYASQAGSPTYAFTGARSAMTTPFQTLPLTVADAAPTATATTATTLQLTWTNFAPGATYTPQVARADAHGFPLTAWQSGTPTAGTSGTVSGLAAGTTYRVRIASDAPTYSSWLTTATGPADGAGSMFAGVVR